jgi:hypothetical protein
VITFRTAVASHGVVELGTDASYGVERRAVKVARDGFFSDSFAPLEVRVYRTA